MKNQTVADQLTRARTALVLDQPFVGVLALRLRLVEDAGIKTASVDGKIIRYNPAFVAGLSPGTTKTLLAHEVFHCVYDHIGRRGTRNPRKHNQAGDYVINETLEKAGFDPIKGWLRSSVYDGMSSDEVYTLLPDDDDEGKDPLDDCEDGDGESTEVNATDWKVATIQAAEAARAMGKLPASMARFVEELTASKVDWKAILQRFVSETSKNDYSWMRPNRRFLAQGMLLPTLHSENMGEIVVAIDTSGSINQATLNAFGSEIKAIVQSVRPEKTTVEYADTEVNHVDEFGPNDELHFEMHGGGGTSFVEAFEYVVEHSIKPVCFVYLTDGYGRFPEASPDYPVLWCMTTDVIAPFGETVRIEL